MGTMQSGTVPPQRSINVGEQSRSDEHARKLNSKDLDQLRTLQTEIRDLQRIVASVRKGEATLKDHVEYIKKTIQDIQVLLPGLVQMELKDDGEDAIRHLRNVLENMGENPLLLKPDNNSHSTEQLLRYSSQLEEQCQQFIYCAGLLTIPERVNEWLDKSWPGYYIPFHAVFEEEMPVKDRVRVLERMAWTPKLIPHGIVDPATGLIYKFSNKARWLIASVVLLAGVLTGVLLALMAVPTLIGGAFQAVESQSEVSLIVLWGAVMAGVVFHIIVATTKQMRSDPDRPPIFALRSILPLVNAKLGNILFKIALTIIGLVGMIFTVEPSKITLLSAFLVGYSLDSIIEVFGTSAEQMASAQVASLKKQIGVADS